MGQTDDFEVGELAEHGQVVDLEQTEVDIFQLGDVVGFEFVFTDDHLARKRVLTRSNHILAVALD